MKTAWKKLGPWGRKEEAVGPAFVVSDLGVVEGDLHDDVLVQGRAVEQLQLFVSWLVSYSPVGWAVDGRRWVGVGEGVGMGVAATSGAGDVFVASVGALGGGEGECGACLGCPASIVAFRAWIVACRSCLGWCVGTGVGEAGTGVLVQLAAASSENRGCECKEAWYPGGAGSHGILLP